MTYFETIKCYDEEIFNIKYHQNRITKTIGMNINLRDYIYPPYKELTKCKVIYDENGIINILFEKYKPRDIKIFNLVFDDNINYKYKKTNRDDLDKLFAQKGVADEIIIIKNGLVTDTTIANIAIFHNNQWITPRIPLLNGTTKNRYIDKKLLIQKDVTVKQLLNTKKIALLNAMIDFKIIDDFEIINKNMEIK